MLWLFSFLLFFDSHTAGEPTRVVIAGGPPLADDSLQSRVEMLRSRYDSFRRAVLYEPRGSEVIVGALLCTPHDPTAAAGVIFFNDVSYLGMCGHGSIGLIATLAHLGRLAPGTHRIETPVGLISATLHHDGAVSITNVPSYRYRSLVKIEVPEYGTMHGDIAWGGNWFFLVADHNLSLHIENRADDTGVIGLSLRGDTGRRRSGHVAGRDDPGGYGDHDND